MVARPSVIFGDDMKNFLDDDLLAGALRSNREVDVFVLRMARQFFFTTHPPMPFDLIVARRIRQDSIQ
jgi:hypothetical protein